MVFRNILLSVVITIGSCTPDDSDIRVEGDPGFVRPTTKELHVEIPHGFVMPIKNDIRGEGDPGFVRPMKSDLRVEGDPGFVGPMKSDIPVEGHPGFVRPMTKELLVKILPGFVRPTKNDVSSDGKTRRSYYDLLHILKAKCEKEKDLLTELEIQCCQKISNDKANAPFSIIRQNTDIMRFTNAIDQSLFKILLNHFSQNPYHSDLTTNDSTTESKDVATVRDESALRQCLKEKASCQDDLAKPRPSQCVVQLPSEENKRKPDDEPSIPSHEIGLQALQEKLEVYHGEIARLTKKLECTVRRLAEEENKSKSVKAAYDDLKINSQRTVESLTQCLSSRVAIKMKLADVQSSLAAKSEQLARMVAEENAVAAAESRLSKLAAENKMLREDLEHMREALNEKDSQLQTCAGVKSKLRICEAHLGHCHSNSSLKEEQWRDKFDECSVHLNESKELLIQANDSVIGLQGTVYLLREAGKNCSDKLGDSMSENSRLRKETVQLGQDLSTMRDKLKTQTDKVIRLEEQTENCSQNTMRLQSSIASYRNDLSKQLESYSRLLARFHEQSNTTVLEREAKEACQRNLHESTEDNGKCYTSLEQERELLKTMTLQAEQCSADHTYCRQQLAMSEAQSRNCTPSGSVDKYKDLLELCRTAEAKHISSNKELAIKVGVLEEERNSCQQRLKGVREDSEECHTTNSDLRIALSEASEARSASQVQLQEVATAEASCQATLSSCRKELMYIQMSVTQQQTSRDQCLARIQELVERTGSLQESNSELSTSLMGMTKRHEDCEQERNAAFVTASSLNATVESCQRRITTLSTETSSLQIELDKCVHMKNLTAINVTAWRQQHEHCDRDLEEAEARYMNLTRQCDAWRLRVDTLTSSVTGWEKEREQLLAERRTLLVQVLQYQVNINITNQTFHVCSERLQLAREEVRQQQAAEQETSGLLHQCTASLATCQSPPHRCPRDQGDNKYWDVDRTIGRRHTGSARELTGCAMASADSGDGSVMRHFCQKHGGQMLRVADRDGVIFVHDFLHDREGKFLVETCADNACFLGTDLEQDTSNEEVCYYVERTKTSVPALKHANCKGATFNVMCWAPYEHEYGADNADVSLPPSSADGANEGNATESGQGEYWDYL